MTPERIAELIYAFSTGLPDWPLEVGEGAELCRLALLGLRVEEAPVASIVTDALGNQPRIYGTSVAELRGQHGKRVAIVVLP